jgi:O-antigen/teichoic acid export membrane protein
MPNMSRLCSEGKDQEALELFARAAAKASRIVMALFAFCFFFADEIIVLLFGENYQASAIPFRLYLLTLPLRMIHFQPALFAKSRNREILYGSILVLGVNALVSVPLLFWLGPNGAAWGTVAATYLAEVPFMLWRTSLAYGQTPARLLPWWHAFRQLVGALLLATVAFVIGHALPWSTPWVQLVVGTAVFGIGWSIWQWQYLATLPFLSHILPRSNQGKN